MANHRLEGKLALVTGIGRKWYKIIATALANAGADVVVTVPEYLNIDELEIRVDKKSGKLSVVPLKAGNPKDIERVTNRVIKDHNKIDILYNCADVYFAKPMLDTSIKEWQTVINSNLRSTFLWCRAVGKRMIENGGGRIISIVSGLSERGMINGCAYCSSQGGLSQLTKCLALEWAKCNVTVNALGIGWVKDEENNEEEVLQLSNSLARYIPLKRFGQPDDLVSLAVFLASDSSSYINGQVFYVDGGVLAHP